MDQEPNKIDALRQEMNERFEHVDGRLDRIDERFEQVDRRFERTERRLDRIDERFEHVDRQLEELRQGVRHTHVMIEDLRGQIQTVSEGVVALGQRLERSEEAARRHREEDRAFLRSLFLPVSERLDDHERRIERLEAHG